MSLQSYSILCKQLQVKSGSEKVEHFENETFRNESKRNGCANHCSASSEFIKSFEKSNILPKTLYDLNIPKAFSDGGGVSLVKDERLYKGLEANSFWGFTLSPVAATNWYE